MSSGAHKVLLDRDDPGTAKVGHPAPKEIKSIMASGSNSIESIHVIFLKLAPPFPSPRFCNLSIRSHLHPLPRYYLTCTSVPAIKIHKSCLNQIAQSVHLADAYLAPGICRSLLQKTNRTFSARAKRTEISFIRTRCHSSRRFLLRKRLSFLAVGEFRQPCSLTGGGRWPRRSGVRSSGPCFLYFGDFMDMG
jgi:hypothetical protein